MNELQQIAANRSADPILANFEGAVRDGMKPKPLHVSQHADLLNALDDMQRSVAYAVRRPILAQAERLIASQEATIASIADRIGNLEADLASRLKIDSFESLVKYYRDGAWRADEMIASCLAEDINTILGLLETFFRDWKQPQSEPAPV